ncbi:Serine/threonine-protein kinase rio1 [Ceratocystis fimbriata CBS 114723]|uniref:Serine/threonine-protein kinase RIO1 n=1 Tax=Ceratocystis fimbriata CBS 114723 TaxID=1035309 RepID=A0A2C5WUK8_9PEZI|nr:Serine/threonine-protein kinase rio1 [Ceratocystis fimbriata CBS 114723]
MATSESDSIAVAAAASSEVPAPAPESKSESVSVPVIPTVSEPAPVSSAAIQNSADEPYNEEYDDEDDELSDIEWVENSAASSNARRNPQTAGAASKPTVNTKARVDDQISSLSHHASKLKIGAEGVSGRDLKTRDKSDRATSELVMDQRTRMILFKMIERGIFSEVHGAVSTGKEANVYEAILNPDLADGDADARPVHKAVKIYKTSILVFKDRERYIAGEHRFSKGADKSNSHKMVKLWAEKEFRNLKRIYAAGIPSPEPIALKNNVLVMSFLGDRKGWAYPRLRDAPIDTEETWQAMYLQLLGLMRIMYQVCRLVHADLSEYNILYNKNKLYIIDVSQSVEPDHPHSLEFLRMDIKNVGDFFRRKSVNTLSDRVIFDFISHPKGPVDEAGMASKLAKLYAEQPFAEDSEKAAAELEVSNAVFRQQYIPQTLEQVIDIEKDAMKIGQGQGDDLVYRNLLADKVIAKEESNEEEEEDDDEDESGSDDEEESGSADEGRFAKGTPRGKKHEDKEAKKAHKMAVKEAKRDKRKEKIPKHLKKKLVSTSSRKKKA